jgi:hypothetical protein
MGMMDHEKYVSSKKPLRFMNKQSSSFIVACPVILAFVNTSLTSSHISAQATL